MMVEKMKQWTDFYKDIDTKGSIILRNLVKEIVGPRYDEQRKMVRLVKRAVEDYKRQFFANCQGVFYAENSQFEFFRFMIEKINLKGESVRGNNFMEFLREKFEVKYRRRYRRRKEGEREPPEFTELNLYYVILEDRESEKLEKIKLEEYKTERRQRETKQCGDMGVAEYEGSSMKLEESGSGLPQRSQMLERTQRNKLRAMCGDIIQGKNMIKDTQQLKKSKEMLRRKRLKRRSKERRRSSRLKRNSSKNYDFEIIMEMPIEDASEASVVRNNKKSTLDNIGGRTRIHNLRSTRKSRIKLNESESNMSDIESDYKEIKRKRSAMMSLRRKTYENELIKMKNIDLFLKTNEISLEKSSVVTSYIDNSDRIFHFRITQVTPEAKNPGIDCLSMDLEFLNEKCQNGKTASITPDEQKNSSFIGRIYQSEHFQFNPGDSVILYDPVIMKIPNNPSILVYFQIYRVDNP